MHEGEISPETRGCLAQYKPYWIITRGQRTSVMLWRTYSTSTFILWCGVQTQMAWLPQTFTEMRGDVFRGSCRQALLCLSFSSTSYMVAPIHLFSALRKRETFYNYSFASLSKECFFLFFFFQPWRTCHLDRATSVTCHYKADHYRFPISGSESLSIMGE